MKGQIVLVGMMGVGKTAVGHELARLLNCPFVDSDAEIERAAAMTIPEIFARDGEAFFRDRESQVLARILEGPRGVVATGGGAWIQPRNRALIREFGVAVWLDVPLDLLWQRLRGKSGRPLLEAEDPYARLERLLEIRNPVYRRADLRISAAAEDTAPDTARAVRAAISRHRPAFLEST